MWIDDFKAWAPFTMLIDAFKVWAPLYIVWLDPFKANSGWLFYHFPHNQLSVCVGGGSPGDNFVRWDTSISYFGKAEKIILYLVSSDIHLQSRYLLAIKPHEKIVNAFSISLSVSFCIVSWSKQHLATSYLDSIQKTILMSPKMLFHWEVEKLICRHMLV